MEKSIKIRKILKYVLANLFIIISYFFILSSVGIHGEDDFLANTYYYRPNLTFSECVNYIIDRALNWNMRIGEILYFTVGCFNKYVFWITASIIYIVFTNLIAYFALGKKEFKEGKYVGTLLIITHLLNLVVSPVVAEEFFWMGGIYNHLFSVVLALIVMIPFRDMLDGARGDTLTSITPKYIIYLVLCFFVGFGSEATTGAVILSMFLANLIIFIKDKKVDKLKLLPLMVLSVSYILFLYLSTKRIEIMGNFSLGIYSKYNKFSVFVENRGLQFIVLLIITFIYFCILKLSDRKGLVRILFILACTFFSIVAMQFATYFINRAIVIIDAGISIAIVYFIYKILEKININIINIIVIILSIAYMIYNVYIQRKLYLDYNYYESLRHTDIISQIGSKYPLDIKAYDRKESNKLYNMYYRYIDVFERVQFSETNLRLRYNYTGEFNIRYNIVEWEKLR